MGVGFSKYTLKCVQPVAASDADALVQQAVEEAEDAVVEEAEARDGFALEVRRVAGREALETFPIRLTAGRRWQRFVRSPL